MERSRKIGTVSCQRYASRAGDQAHLSGYSVNQGSGRRMSRAAAQKGLKQDQVNAANREAGIVVNTDGVVPIDESKDCY